MTSTELPGSRSSSVPGCHAQSSKRRNNGKDGNGVIARGQGDGDDCDGVMMVVVMMVIAARSPVPFSTHARFLGTGGAPARFPASIGQHLISHDPSDQP